RGGGGILHNGETFNIICSQPGKLLFRHLQIVDQNQRINLITEGIYPTDKKIGIVGAGFTASLISDDSRNTASQGGGKIAGWHSQLTRTNSRHRSHHFLFLL